MLSRRQVLACSVLAAFWGAAPARAAETPFTAESFAAARRAGKLILVEVHASWCPVCKAQIPIIAELAADPKFADLVILRVDFDAQKATLRNFRVLSQSTLIVFKGEKELGRSVGDINPFSIEELLLRGV